MRTGWLLYSLRQIHSAVNGSAHIWRDKKGNTLRTSNWPLLDSMITIFWIAFSKGNPFFLPVLPHHKCIVCAILPEQKCCTGAFTCWRVHWSHCGRQAGSFLLMVQRSTRQECWCSVFKCGYKKKRTVSAFTWLKQDQSGENAVERCWV